MSRHVMKIINRARKNQIGAAKGALITLLVGILLPFIALEWWTSNKLFDHVSYSNSINLDKQLETLAVDKSWNILAVGSSEVRWGFTPSEFDKSIQENSTTPSSEPTKSFNLGIDGFSPGLLYIMFGHWDLKTLAPNLKVLLVGVNITENNTMAEEGYIPGSCHALQNPVLTSPFAIDHGLDASCIKSSWKDPIINLAENLNTVRYRQSLRSFLLPYAKSSFIGMQSTGLKHANDGYQPHQSLGEAYNNFKSSWDRLLVEKKESPERFQALPEGNYPQFLQDGGFFDRWRQFGEDQHIEVVFYALPTNPMLIDINERRADYLRHSELISEWAKAKDVIYIDLGIKDEYVRNDDFSDHRHLSQYGAPKFSKELGRALAQQAKFTQLFNGQRYNVIVSNN